ncbi:MAG: TIGR01777 family oxidoreductase [Psychromonas sp.]
MMASFLITGGTGLIGSALIAKLLESDNQITVLTRDIRKAKKKLPETVRLIKILSDFEHTKALDYVINLAGEPIADKRWSAKQKVKLWQSRVDFTQQLVNWIKQRAIAPKALISGSATGWYGDGLTKILTEKSTAVNEYTHLLCDAWEAEAQALASTNIRVCISRTGLVLSKQGGFLSKLTLPFKLGLGARLGNGQQYIAWIHIDDMVAALIFLIADQAHQSLSAQKTLNPCRSNPLNQQQPKQFSTEKMKDNCGLGSQPSSLPHGIFNLTSPHPMTHQQFNKIFARQLNRCYCLMIPASLLKLMLGEMAQLLLAGQRAIPQGLSDHGFVFNYPNLPHALAHIMASSPDQA